MFSRKCRTVTNIRNYLFSAFDRSVGLDNDSSTWVSVSITSGKRIISVSARIVAKKLIIDCKDNYFIFREPQQSFSSEEKCLSYLYDLTARIRKELDI